MMPPPHSLLLLLAMLEWLSVAVIAHEERVPVWTRLIVASNEIVTDANAPTYPSSRAKSAVWMDESKATLWMFGGLVTGNPDSPSCSETRQTDCAGDILLDELWQYKVSTNTWKLIQFSNSSSNRPTPRHGAVACGESGDFMVVFGGYAAVNKTLSETWIFNVKDETWRAKEAIGEENCKEQPESRADMLHWCTADSLWILGGIGSKGNILTDMWKYNYSNHCWTLQYNATRSFDKLKLNSTSLAHSRAGPQPDSPTWLLSDTELVFMSNVTPGASSSSDPGSPGQPCEMWTLSITDDNLEWKPYILNSETRKTSVSHAKTYVKFRGDSPACRTSAATWVDESDNMWLFGGHRHISRYINRTSVFVCDEWVLDMSNNTWIQWLQAKYSTVQKYLFRTVPPRLNIPSPRAHTVSWYHNGTLYMFGGEGLNADGTVEYLNDLWSWHLGHPTPSPHKLLLPPTGVFFVTLGALCFMAVCVFSTIFVAKASSPQAPRLKPPSVNNGKIKYSPVSTTEDVLFEA